MIPDFGFQISESEIRNQEFGIRNQESGIRNQEFGIRNSESGIRNSESGIRYPESIETPIFPRGVPGFLLEEFAEVLRVFEAQ
ncbi:MAG: hypothetical protein RL204_1478 [Bacteroidota bacterium]|jgi:hypothetical protein